MNKLILVAVAAAAASGIAAAPAVAGLSHNPSFSHQLPVRVPSGAQTVKVADEHQRGKPAASVSPTASPSRDREAEPGDDRGVDATPSPGGHNDAVDNDVNDDNGVHEGLEPGDDNGRDGQVASQPGASVTTAAEPEPGDDKGGAVTTPVTTPTTQQAEKGDDKGGSSGGSSSGRGSSGHHDG